MSLARLWRDQGKRSEALGLVGPVCNLFTEGFGTPVLQQAKARFVFAVIASAAKQSRCSRLYDHEIATAPAGASQ